VAAPRRADRPQADNTARTQTGAQGRRESRILVGVLAAQPVVKMRRAYQAPGQRSGRERFVERKQEGARVRSARQGDQHAVIARPGKTRQTGRARC
jgi:hypothetical protein